jgi:hypothetical protein
MQLRRDPERALELAHKALELDGRCAAALLRVGELHGARAPPPPGGGRETETDIDRDRQRAGFGYRQRLQPRDTSSAARVTGCAWARRSGGGQGGFRAPAAFARLFPQGPRPAPSAAPSAARACLNRLRPEAPCLSLELLETASKTPAYRWGCWKRLPRPLPIAGATVDGALGRMTHRARDASAGGRRWRSRAAWRPSRAQSRLT